jgi:hypothetical protein
VDRIECAQLGLQLCESRVCPGGLQEASKAGFSDPKVIAGCFEILLPAIGKGLFGECVSNVKVGPFEGNRSFGAMLSLSPAGSRKRV